MAASSDHTAGDAVHSENLEALSQRESSPPDADNSATVTLPSQTSAGNSVAPNLQDAASPGTTNVSQTLLSASGSNANALSAPTATPDAAALPSSSTHSAKKGKKKRKRADADDQEDQLATSDEEFEVARISAFIHGKVHPTLCCWLFHAEFLTVTKDGQPDQYEITWKGYSESHNTWEPVNHLTFVVAVASWWFIV